MTEIGPVKVTTLADLNKVIEELKPVSIDSKTRIVNMDNIEDLQGKLYKKFPVKITDDGQPMVRKLLVDGFNLLKRQQNFDAASGIFEEDIDSFGGFYPAVKPLGESGTGWVTAFVSKHLDGRIEDLSIVWDVTEGRFKLDPWTGQLTKITEHVTDIT